LFIVSESKTGINQNKPISRLDEEAMGNRRYPKVKCHAIELSGSPVTERRSIAVSI
jgi:hypothetical protein